MVTLAELSRPWLHNEPPLVDRPTYEAGRDELVDFYWENGYVVLPGIMPDDLIDAYCEEWLANVPRENGGPAVMGYDTPIPYMKNWALMEICSFGPLHETMERILGEPAGLHLNLTGWRSTTRNWHQDGYLNPDSNKDYYVAVWIALDDIHPDSGPFQYVAGSHRLFDPIRNQSMLDALTPEERTSPDWPTYSERILTPLFEAEIEERGLEISEFLAKKGDVLFWHPRLLHRGSIAKNPEMERKALISHYSGILHRPDFPTAVTFSDGWYFPIKR